MNRGSKRPRDSGTGRGSKGKKPKRPTRGRGRKKECPHGQDCQYLHEHQHTSEYFHADAQETSQRKRKRERDQSFSKGGRKLGREAARRLGGRSASSSSSSSTTSSSSSASTQPRDAALMAALARSMQDQQTPSHGLSTAISDLAVGSEKPKKRRRVRRAASGSTSTDDEVVDLVSPVHRGPSPPTQNSNRNQYSSSVYGAHASEKSKQGMFLLYYLLSCAFFNAMFFVG